MLRHSTDMLKETLIIKSIRNKRKKTVAIFHKVRRNSHFIALIFVENNGSFSKIKIIGLDQSFLKEPMRLLRCYAKALDY